MNKFFEFKDMTYFKSTRHHSYLCKVHTPIKRFMKYICPETILEKEGYCTLSFGISKVHNIFFPLFCYVWKPVLNEKY